MAVTTNDHTLHIPFVFSYMRRGGKGSGGTNAETKTTSTDSTTKQENEPTTTAPTQTTATTPAAGDVVHPYENSIKTLTQVGTVEEFWQTYDFLRRPNDLPSTTDYHFFRSGIKPTWEDPSNAKGGKWIIRLPKGLASRYWEEIILALIGHQFSGIPDGEICGAVLSVRYSEDILGVWNRTAFDRDMVDKIRDAIKKVLQLPSFANMEYKPHQNSLQDRSSYRNTQVWKPKSLEGRTAATSNIGAGTSGGDRLTDTTTASTTNASSSRRPGGSWTTDRDKQRRGTETRGSWR